MNIQPPEIINKYEVLFAARTGVTILMPHISAFDCGIEIPVSFTLSPDSERDLLIDANGRTAVLKNLERNFLDDVTKRGYIMFYETKGDEVVRCTPCSYRRK
mgnify:CR=1 FL=1